MEILTNFGIQPKLLLAQIVNFLIILFLLRRFFFGPISKALEDRKNRIEESLKNADLIEEKLRATEEQSKKTLEQAQEEAQKINSAAKEQAAVIAAQAQKDAHQTIEAATGKAKAQIESERVQMKKSLEKETLSLVVDVVKKVLARNLNPKEKGQLTTQALSEISRKIH